MAADAKCISTCTILVSAILLARHPKCRRLTDAILPMILCSDNSLGMAYSRHYRKTVAVWVSLDLDILRLGRIYPNKP
jgi:hypothetical protein